VGLRRKLVEKFAQATILFVINAFVCWRAFRLEWSSRMDSIEGAYIGISRHMLASWGDLSWGPAWYEGIPFRNAYPPLLHLLVALWAAARAHHVVTAIFYCAKPVFAYLLIERLSKRAFPSFCAALFYSVVSQCGLLVKKIALDMNDPLTPRRLGTLIAYGDGPHLAGLAIIPLAVYCLDIALQKRRPIYYGLTALSFIAVASTNWLSAFSLAALLACYLAAFRPWRDWAVTAGIGAAAYLVAMPWIPPSLIRTVQFNAQTIEGDYRNSLVLLAAIAPFGLAALAGVKWLMKRFRTPPYLQMLVLFSALMGGITLGDTWFGVSLLPQASRYQIEMDLAFTITVAMALARALEQRPAIWRRLALAVLVLFSVEQIARARSYAKDLIKPVQIGGTLEYRVARWFDEHMPGERVMVPGSCQFWLSAFSDSPQLGGGYAQGRTNPLVAEAEYVIMNGVGTDADAETALLWLKAFGVQAIQAGGAGTREYYRAFHIGGKFRGVLEELWREGDDGIYRVPQRSHSLAHVMGGEQLVVRRPVNGLDLEQIQRYVAALDDPSLPTATFTWKTQHSAEVRTSARPGQIVSLQITFDRGWKVTANGAVAELRPDGLGLSSVDPKCNGECRLELEYVGDLESRRAKWLCGLTILCWLAFTVRSVWLRNRRPLRVIM
jgi:hypothetical protein